MYGKNANIYLKGVKRRMDEVGKAGSAERIREENLPQPYLETKLPQPYRPHRLSGKKIYMVKRRIFIERVESADG